MAKHQAERQRAKDPLVSKAASKATKVVLYEVPPCPRGCRSVNAEKMRADMLQTKKRFWIFRKAFRKGRSKA